MLIRQSTGFSLPNEVYCDVECNCYSLCCIPGGSRGVDRHPASRHRSLTQLLVTMLVIPAPEKPSFVTKSNCCASTPRPLSTGPRFPNQAAHWPDEVVRAECGRTGAKEGTRARSCLISRCFIASNVTVAASCFSAVTQASYGTWTELAELAGLSLARPSLHAHSRHSTHSPFPQHVYERYTTSSNLAHWVQTSSSTRAEACSSTHPQGQRPPALPAQHSEHTTTTTPAATAAAGISARPRSCSRRSQQQALSSSGAPGR